MISIKEIMKTDFPKLFSSDSVEEAVRVMDNMKVDYLLIYEEGRIKGVTTSHGLVGNPPSRLIMDCAIEPISTISEEAPLEEALKILEEKQVNFLVILNKNEMSAGIITREIIISFLYQELKKSNVELKKAKTEIESFSKGLEEKVRARTYELSVLYEVSNAISYTLDYQTLLKLIMESLFKIIDYDICASLLFDSRAANFTLKPSYPQSARFVDKVKNTLIDSTSLLTGENIRKKNLSVFMIPAAPDAKPKVERSFDKMRSFFNVPFIVRGKTIGMINVSSSQDNAFSEYDVKLIYTIANQASNAIERLQAVITAEKSKMEFMVESMAEGVIMADERGEIVVLNPQARIMLGFDLAENVTSTVLNEKLKVFGLDKAIQKSQETARLVTKEIIIPKEESQILRCDIGPVKDAAGEIIGILFILRDITREKETDRMKTEFISTVSHELRTPLTTMKEFASIISDEIPGKLTKDQKEYVDIIKGNIDRLARLINDLLDIAKIEAGKTELKKTLVDVANLANITVSAFKPEAEGKRIEFRTIFPTSQINVNADPDKIIEVFTNLIGNAIKFTPENGTITVEIKDMEKEVECIITDTGVGIAPENIGNLFTKFQQFGRTAGAGSKGTGLGLAITKELIKLHHGTIWAESQFGHGSKFIFTLPREAELSYLKEILTSKIERIASFGETLALLFVDIVNFNELKEQLDKDSLVRLLATIKDIASATLRKTEDVIFSLEQKRIAAVFTVKHMNDTKAVMDRLKSALQVKLLLKKDIEAEVILSMSVAIYGEHIDSVDKIIKGTSKIDDHISISLIGRREVVIVHDEEVILKSVKSYLEKTGDFRVYAYSTAEEALEQIVLIKPEVVLVDIVMPQMSGYELVGRLYSYEGCQEIPIIFISAYDVDDQQLDKLKSKRVSVLKKPFSVKSLLDKINSI